MGKEKTLNVDVDKLKKQGAKNTRGELGPVCNNCGGYGFTLGFNGSLGCHYCNQTGVAAMTNHELQHQVVNLGKQMVELKELIIKLGKEKINE